MLTKSDYLTFLESPLHLWAQKNNKVAKAPSVFEVNIMNQGYEVEKYAQEYLEKFVINTEQDEQTLWQKSFTDKEYEIKTDALVYKPKTDSYDLYEIKQGTKVKKENLRDATYQFLILNKQIKLDNVFILRLNKEYVRFGRLNIEELFVAENVNDQVKDLKDIVDLERARALAVTHSLNADEIEHCFNPKTCICPDLCHPGLPHFSIYDIPRLNKKAKKQLLEMDVIETKDIPENFKLNPKQLLVRQVIQTGEPHIDEGGIRHDLSEYVFPLYFIDYETYNAAIPMFDGYHPQQQMVFQYSLHVLNHVGGEIKHTEHLSVGKEEPALPLLEKLSGEIGKIGTIISWNKTFEMTQNKKMAEIHPQHEAFLLDMNERMVDLGDFINYGLYVHPEFKGRWSIKCVLPVMAPELSYKELEIGKGDEAMMAWKKMVHPGEKDEVLNEGQKKEKAEALLKYCELDTFAMVRIWEELRKMV
jgi:hypothetical protein